MGSKKRKSHDNDAGHKKRYEMGIHPRTQMGRNDGPGKSKIHLNDQEKRMEGKTMTKARMNHYKKLSETIATVELKTEKIYQMYYNGMISAAEQEKELARIIKENYNSELIISAVFAIIASRPTASNYKETVNNIFTSELKNYVERMERIRMERELYELSQTLAG